MKTIFTVMLVTLSVSWLAMAPASASFGVQDLPLIENPGFGPCDLPQPPGPA